MFFVSLIRVIKFSLQDIGRNIWLSIVTITILVLALFSVNMLLTVQVISESAIEAVKEKVDVTMYLDAEAEDTEILALKQKIENLSEVEEVSYISKAEALNVFRAKNQDNPEINQALKALGINPLTPSFIIKPQNLENTEELITQLNKLDEDIIESKNFTDHQLLLGKINSITDKVSEAGLMIISIFIITTILVVYNSVKVAMYTHRMEIGIMRLVGASNSFIYMPFIVSAVIYVLISMAILIALYYPFLSLLQPYLEAFFIDYNVNLISYYNHNFLYIFGIQFLGAAVINVVASLLAVRKYADI